MSRRASGLGALVLALGLACGGLPADGEGRDHFRRHEADLRGLCEEGPGLLGDLPHVHVDHGPMPEGLRPRLVDAEVSAAMWWSRPRGLELTIHDAGLSVSGASMSLFCGPEAPYDVVPDTHPSAAAPGEADGAFCTAIDEGWWLCRDWT